MRMCVLASVAVASATLLSTDGIAKASDISAHTDKDSYASGEMVTLEVRFAEDHTFLIPKYGLEALPTHLQIEHAEADGVWRSIQLHPDIDLPERGPMPTPQLVFVRITGAITYHWNQLTDFKKKTRAASGRYRFAVVGYARLRAGGSESQVSFSARYIGEAEIDEASRITAYSNEFQLQ